LTSLMVNVFQPPVEALQCYLTMLNRSHTKALRELHGKSNIFYIFFNKCFDIS
uniref:Ovule protein n=1 Tax=Haemonchus placei TaxID=6290 RepID=A0A0N4WQF0_HAEPC